MDKDFENFILKIIGNVRYEYFYIEKTNTLRIHISETEKGIILWLCDLDRGKAIISTWIEALQKIVNVEWYLDAYI